ncbi:MAG: sensor domain-containing diguanylate cyclase [Actinobacteria bacterium]|jgi:diguanylate cyclase (GGDEF)-like protein|nr:MAG: sensor domain-containing diguanylate cyclase [Actinomycetota bacterium]
MGKDTRIAFIGFNPACARLVQILSSAPGAEIVGILGKEVPADWPASSQPPTLFSARKDLMRAGAPDLLLVAEEGGELKGIPSKCRVVYVYEDSPNARLLEILPTPSQTGLSHQDDIREVVSICTSVNVIEAYSDPMPKLAELLDRAMAVCGAELGVILLPGDVLDELDVVLARGDGAQELVGRGLSATASLCGRAFDTGMVQQEELDETCEEYSYLGESGVKRLLALPLRAEGRVIGVFSLGRGEEDFDLLKMPLLTLIADQAGLAVLISRLYSELETNVVRDVASGLFNLHYFQHQLSQEVSRARRYSLNVCLLFFEIDDYEGYTDRNGRYMADFILTDVGNIVKRNTREVDTAARYGENLFAVLLPETRRLGAMRLAERIRKVVEEYPFPSREKKEVEKLTVCVGVSSFPANAENDQDLTNKALSALTAAKNAGPNNVRLYSNNLAEETA